uniref:Uncharacterized protein n=1 Tax=Mycena chlorophos TaxID=658473 RepID=A0ABQ0LNX5_MYCCL|nr:predicted protein [Mycena chlorophos]
MDPVFDLKALNSLSAPVRKCAKQLLKVELENPGPEDRFSDYAALGPLGLAPGFRARSVDQLRLLPLYWRLLGSAIPSAHHLDDPQPRCTFQFQIIILALLGIGEVPQETINMEPSRLLFSRMLPWVLFLQEHYASLPRLCHLRKQTEEDILCAFLNISLDVVQEDPSLLTTPGLTRIIFRTWALTLDNDSSPPLGRTPPLPPHLSMYHRGIFTPAHLDEILEALGGRLEEIPKLVVSTVKRVLRCCRTARRAGTTSSLEVDFALWSLGPVRTTLEALEEVIPSLDSMLSRIITGKIIGETLEELTRNTGPQRSKIVRESPQRSKIVRESLSLTTLLYILAQITTVKRAHLVAALEQSLLRSIAIFCQTLPTGDSVAPSVMEFFQKILQPCTLFADLHLSLKAGFIAANDFVDAARLAPRQAFSAALAAVHDSTAIHDAKAPTGPRESIALPAERTARLEKTHYRDSPPASCMTSALCLPFTASTGRCGGRLPSAGPGRSSSHTF